EANRARVASGGWNSPTDQCPVGYVLHAAEAQVEAMPGTNFDHVLVMMPDATGCPADGAAYVNDNLSYSRTLADPTVFVHEIGHNLGRLHASILECVDENGAR